jgi:POT family proton-dependent oligopeptide transporter
MLGTLAIEDAIVSDDFIALLNQKADSANRYAKAEFQIKEILDKANETTAEGAKAKLLAQSKKAVLVYENNLSNIPQMVSEAEAETITENSLTGNVLSALRNDSLSLGLSVFKNLGFFAIGCGMLLLLLGRVVSRWMHGIK